MSVTGRSWKYAAAITFVCTGFVAAGVVGVKVVRYHYLRTRYDEGRHYVQSEDGTKTMVFPMSLVDDPQQAVGYAEEIALLKQQGERELVGVSEIEVNGQHDSRLLSYEYNLSDGRTITLGEYDPDDTGPRTLVGERLEEACQLLREASSSHTRTVVEDGQSGTARYSDGDVGVESDGRSGIEMRYSLAGDSSYEAVVRDSSHGQGAQDLVFSFTTWGVALSDGTKVVWSIGTPQDDQ